MLEKALSSRCSTLPNIFPNHKFKKDCQNDTVSKVSFLSRSFRWKSFLIIWFSGPKIDKRTGNNINPCKAPTSTNPKKATKTVKNNLLVLKANGTVPRNVDIAPVRMEDPIVDNMFTVFS